MADSYIPPAEQAEILARLALYQFTIGDRRPRVSPHDALGDLYMVLTGGWTDSPMTTAAALPSRDQIPVSDVLAALRLVPGERSALEEIERTLIEAALDRGETWATLAKQLSYGTRQNLQQRYRRLGGKRTWPSGPRPTGRTGDTPQ